MLTAISYRTDFDIWALFRLFCLCALVIAAIPLTIAAVNLVTPLIVALAGKALAGGVGTVAFALWFKP